MEAEWRETGNQGRVLFLKHEGREIAHLPGYAAGEAVSLWEGIAGPIPFGRIARWRWSRGLNRVFKTILKAEAAYSPTV